MGWGRRVVRTFFRFVAVATAALFVYSAEIRPADARDPDLLSFGVGAFDVLDDDSTASFKLEYRSGYELVWIIKPFAGLMGTADEAIYAYGGFLLDIELGDFVLTPSATAGYFDEGDGKDLGHELEFRTGIELSYKFSNNMRLGVGFYHISNASIGDENPGSEIVEAVFSIPLNF